MTLQSPFNGAVFDQMLAEAVDTVEKHYVQALPSAPSAADSTLYKQGINAIMLNTLNDVAFGGLPGYSFGSDNTALVSRIANESGTGPTFTETIVSLIYTDSATGDIPGWYLNPAEVVSASLTSKNTFDALQPSFASRVAATIFKPILNAIGVTGAQALLVVEILIVIVALIAVAYVWRSFK